MKSDHTTLHEASNQLHGALAYCDKEALRHKRFEQPLIIFAVVLSPIGTVLLAIQALAFPQSGMAAMILIASELIILFIALLFSFLEMGRGTHERWLNSRLRAEILRREYFLLYARVGPYLNLADSAAAAN